MKLLFFFVFVPAVLLGCGYLCACAGGQKWLTLREWWSGPVKFNDGHVPKPCPWPVPPPVANAAPSGTTEGISADVLLALTESHMAQSAVYATRCEERGPQFDQSDREVLRTHQLAHRAAANKLLKAAKALQDSSS